VRLYTLRGGTLFPPESNVNGGLPDDPQIFALCERPRKFCVRVQSGKRVLSPSGRFEPIGGKCCVTCGIAHSNWVRARFRMETAICGLKRLQRRQIDHGGRSTYMTTPPRIGGRSQTC